MEWLAALVLAATIHVQSDDGFATAVAQLRSSGGTIVLEPREYHSLVVGERSTRPLRIVALHGARAERVSFDGTRNVVLDGLRIAPRGTDAAVVIHDSEHVTLERLSVSAQGTRYAATVEIPDSRFVTIRRSEFSHCGDRSPVWTNCVLLGSGSNGVFLTDNRFHDCYGCDFVHGRFGSGLTVRRNTFDRALPCRLGPLRCGHQDLIELFEGRWFRFESNRFGVYKVGGAQLYLTDAIDHVLIRNNVFRGTDPRVPGYQARIGLVIGARGSRRLPHYVRVVNNTILTGARRVDGYVGSIRVSSLYAALPRQRRPVFANNVFGVLDSGWPVCQAAGASISNVVLRGVRCSSSDRLGEAHLDALGRPTAHSTLLIDRASLRFAPPTDITGRARGTAPDIGAYEYRSIAQHRR
jgi:hypothetical protein